MMHVRWVSFNVAGRSGFGTLQGDQVSDCTDLLPGVATLRSALAAGALPQVLARAQHAPLLPLQSLALLPPIPDPAKIICVGLNYRQHAAETGAAIPAHPALFVRFANSVVGHGQPVVRPAASVQFDFEGELAVVIGRRVRHLAPSDALQVVAGYACFAENSVRDVQRHAATATSGKNFFHSGAWGPAMVGPDSVGDPGTLRVVTRLNGAVMQDGNTAAFIFDLPTLLAYVTSFTELEPGDVVVTGTPPGVGSARVPPVWMRHGHRLEVEIERVGLLTNFVVDEKA